VRKFWLEKNACYFQLESKQLFFINFNSFFNEAQQAASIIPPKTFLQKIDMASPAPISSDAGLSINFRRIETSTTTVLNSEFEKISTAGDFFVSQSGNRLFLFNKLVNQPKEGIETFYCQGNNLFYIQEGQSSIMKYYVQAQRETPFRTIDFSLINISLINITGFVVSLDEKFIAFVFSDGSKFKIYVFEKEKKLLESSCDEFFRMGFTADSKVFYWAEKINDGRKDPYMVNFVAIPSVEVGEYSDLLRESEC
jgi:hypothetical protein